MTNEELLKTARAITLPKWATHVAIRNDGSEFEPAAWIEGLKEYISEDPSSISNEDYAFGYHNDYWKFFSLEDLKGE